MNHEAAPLGAIRENKPAWQRSGVPGLYRRSNGNFYSRYCINGRRTWRSLDTDQFEAAKLRHERRRGDVETARQVGTAINCDLRTLGALARELEREIARLTAERDEARRMWCEAEVIGNCLSVDDMKRLARAEAKRREWDCFEEDGK